MVDKRNDTPLAQEVASFWRFISSSIDRLVGCLEGLNEQELNWRPLATANRS